MMEMVKNAASRCPREVSDSEGNYFEELYSTGGITCWKGKLAQLKGARSLEFCK